MGRQPHYDFADRIIKLCADNKVEGKMAAHSVPNIFYILRKTMSDAERRKVLRDLCQIAKVEGLDSYKVISAIDNRDFSDLEDCLQGECAVAMAADYIVTRNIKDFTHSRIPAVLPEDFLSNSKIKIHPIAGQSFGVVFLCMATYKLIFHRHHLHSKDVKKDTKGIHFP